MVEAVNTGNDRVITTINNDTDRLIGVTRDEVLPILNAITPAIEAASSEISATIVSEGPYLGPFEYGLGVQEITAALTTVDGSIAASASIVAAAVAAGATSTTAAIVSEGELTRSVLERMLFPLRSLFVYWPVGATIQVQVQSDPIRSFTRVNGFNNDPYILSGLFYSVVGGQLGFSGFVRAIGVVLRLQYYQVVEVSLNGAAFRGNSYVSFSQV